MQFLPSFPGGGDIQACVQTCGSLIPTGLKATVYLNGSPIITVTLFGCTGVSERCSVNVTSTPSSPCSARLAPACTLFQKSCVVPFGTTAIFNSWITKDVRVEVPKSFRVIVRGQKPANVTAKDFMLEILRHARGIWKYKAVGTVDGQLALEAELMCTIRSAVDASQPMGK